MTFGDSNTFGAAPVAVAPSFRLEPQDRWPRVIQTCLTATDVIEESLPGRTTDLEDFDEPVQAGVSYSGLRYLPTALASHQPLDLVVLMLGTNDAKARFKRDAEEIAGGIGRLVSAVTSFQSIMGYAAPDVFVICPPAIAPDVARGRLAEMFADGPRLTAGLADLYRAVARELGADFLDANTVITTDGVDGVHWTAQTHRTFGKAIAGWIANRYPRDFPEYKRERQ